MGIATSSGKGYSFEPIRYFSNYSKSKIEFLFLDSTGDNKL